MDVTAVVLAGGKGSRIGGDKALVQLAGRALISYPVQAAQGAGFDVVIMAKRTTELPPTNTPLLLEPDEPTHPLLGIITALDRYPAIIAIPCDMPFVVAADLAELAAQPHDLATLWPNQPFPSLYRTASRPQLQAALVANQSMRSLNAYSHRAQPMASSTELTSQLSINSPADLAEAEELLRNRR